MQVRQSVTGFDKDRSIGAILISSYTSDPLDWVKCAGPAEPIIIELRSQKYENTVENHGHNHPSAPIYQSLSE